MFLMTGDHKTRQIWFGILKKSINMDIYGFLWMANHIYGFLWMANFILRIFMDGKPDREYLFMIPVRMKKTVVVVAVVV
jgi:hypothetical protein